MLETKHLPRRKNQRHAGELCAHALMVALNKGHPCISHILAAKTASRTGRTCIRQQPNSHLHYFLCVSSCFAGMQLLPHSWRVFEAILWLQGCLCMMFKSCKQQAVSCSPKHCVLPAPHGDWQRMRMCKQACAPGAPKSLQALEALCRLTASRS